MMARLVCSRYNVLVPLHRGRVLAYNSLSGGMALWEAGDRELYERVQGGERLTDGDPAARELAFGGYLVREDVDELAVLQRQYEAHRFDRSAMILTIAPTMACNFGCDYCFQGQDKPVEAMSQEVQDAIVALVERVAPAIKHLHVAWYGGEPLIKLKIIEALSDRFMALAKRRGLKYDAMIVTNGYLLDAEAARSLQARHVKTAQVTLDGLPTYHDQRRHLLSKKGTFARIVDNLQAVAEAVPQLALSIRVNIDARNCDDIHGLIDCLGERGLGRRPNFKLYFAPVEAITEGCHSVADVCMSKSEYGELEAALYRHGHAAGLTALPYPPRFRGTCAAVRPRGFTIIPNGDVHKCWDTVSNPAQRVGSIFDVDALNREEAVMRWLRWTPFVNETCRNCKILPNCAGACAYKFVHASETRGEAAVLPCPSWKYNIKERLVHRAEAMGAIAADDYDAAQIRTDPADVCAEVHVDGQALPAEIEAMMAAKKPRRRLKILSHESTPAS